MSDASTAAVLEGLTAALRDAIATAPGHETHALTATRANALAWFDANGLPHPRSEDWKYTNVRPIARRDFSLGSARDVASDVSEFVDLGAGPDAACTVVLVDGVVAQISPDVPDGLALLPLGEALARHGDSLSDLIGKIADAHADGFAALNASSLSQGVYIKVREGVRIPQPINVVFVGKTDGVAALPRLLIDVGQDAAAHVVEHYVGDAKAAYLTNAVVEINLAERAKLELSKLQEEGIKAFHISTTAARLAESAELVSNALSFGAAIARHDINARFTAPNGNIVLNGLYMGSDRQHVDFHTRLFHAATDCTSEQIYKGILDGHARGVFNGQVHVEPDAQRTQADQSNHNLLLSRNAEIDTKPQLEIYADDVKCSHGTTVGQLDEQMLFYLRSRGIPPTEARGMLTYGFAHDIVERLTLDALRVRAEATLTNILPETGGLGETH